MQHVGRTLLGEIRLARRRPPENLSLQPNTLRFGLKKRGLALRARQGIEPRWITFRRLAASRHCRRSRQVSVVGIREDDQPLIAWRNRRLEQNVAATRDIAEIEILRDKVVVISQQRGERIKIQVATWPDDKPL